MLFIGDLLIRPFFATGLQDFFCSSFYLPHVLPGSDMGTISLFLCKTVKDIGIFCAFQRQGARTGTETGPGRKAEAGMGTGTGTELGAGAEMG